VTEAPPALFDVGAIRSRTTPTVGVLVHDATLVVLGSTQRIEDLDPVALARDHVAVRRRRSGGGAVLLRPDDCWVELWLPASARFEGANVHSTAHRVGEWWSVALDRLGVHCDVHRGGMQHRAAGAIACFAGLGPGELTIDGHKLVGLSQWRAREGAIVSSVIPSSPPSELNGYLATGVAPVAGLADASCLHELLRGVSSASVAAAFTSVLAEALDGLDTCVDPFV